MIAKKRKPPRPDYAFWDTIGSFPEWQVVCLWSDLEPSSERSVLAKPLAIQEKLTAARQEDRIGSDVRKSSSAGRTVYEVWYRRSDLLAYADLISEKPKFLFPDRREISAAPKRSRMHTAHDADESAESLSAMQPREAISETPIAREHAVVGLEEGKHIRANSPLLTVKQLSEKHPAFTELALRNLIFKAKPRVSSTGVVPGNGLDGAIVKVGRKILLDEKRFLEWVNGGPD